MLSGYKVGVIFVSSAIVGATIAAALLFVQNGFQLGDSNRDIAPNFSIPLYGGGSSNFTLSEHMGSPVLINFWASWCAPCRAEFGLIQGVSEEYKPQGLVVFGVNVNDTQDNAERFLRDEKITFPTGPDNEGRVTVDYEVTAMPTTFFLSSDGSIFRKWIGQISDDELRAIVKELMAS
jgi:thiol-disulfide isomerase/thioredoxin